VSMCFQSTIKK